MRDVYREAIRISDATNLRNKKLYDRKLNSFSYVEGDRVMCRNVAARGQYYKFVRPWKPAVIVSKIGDLNYRVRLEGGQMLSVHHNRLKPCHLPAQDPVTVSNRDRPASSAGQIRPRAARRGDIRMEDGLCDGGENDIQRDGEGGAELILTCAAPLSSRAPVPRPRFQSPLSAASDAVPLIPQVSLSPAESSPVPQIPSSPVDLSPARQVPIVPLRRTGRERRPLDRLGY